MEAYQICPKHKWNQKGVYKGTGWIFNSGHFEIAINGFWIEVKPKFSAVSNSINHNILLCGTVKQYSRKFMLN